MKKLSILEVQSLGITGVNSQISSSFLELGGNYPDHSTLEHEALSCVKIFDIFDLLCNMNIRDRNFVHSQILELTDSSINARFSNLIDALKLWASGNKVSAREKFVDHLGEWGQDFVASMMLHMFDFLHGRPDRYHEYLSDDSRSSHPVFGFYYKGLLAFSLCESGNSLSGLALAQSTCLKRNADIYSIHAYIHCLHTDGKFQMIVDYLSSNEMNWQSNRGMNIHITWHLALAYLELNELEKAVITYKRFRNLCEGDHAEQDLDSVNFCVRLFCKSYSSPELSEEHKTLSKNWAPSIYNSLSYFNDIHAALAFMLAGDKGFMKKLLERPPISEMDEETQIVGETMLSAVSEFMHSNYAKCYDLLHSSIGTWYRLGGSRVQREIFTLVLNEAKRRSTSGNTIV